MIPKTIHYCWFGPGEIPTKAKDCIASWHKYMPDWEYKLWNEGNFNVNQTPYTKEAYEAKKYAFVSDYVRLWALCNEGGVYLDTDVVVFKPFDDLLGWNAFVGFEGSKHVPIGTCVMASIADGVWANEQIGYYQGRHFLLPDGSMDLTTNVQFITAQMCKNGFVQDGKEQDYKDLHIFPTDFFCPRQTTGEYHRTENTYCDHLGIGSWTTKESGIKGRILSLFGPNNRTRLIKLKRWFFE